MPASLCRRAAGLVAATVFGTSFAVAQTPTPAAPAKPKQLAISNKPWKGDFDKLLERRMIRVDAPFSRSLYFNDKGRERGLAVELVRDEDLMEMLEAGLVELIVVDDWKARMWAQVLPKIEVRNDLVVRAEAKTGWAIRKDSPKLADEIEDFFRNWAMKQGVAAYRMNKYMKRVKELKDPTGSAEYKRFQETLALFEKYGKKYGFDPLMLAAQGYQESQLDQKAKSHVGALGIMQIMPATGAEMKVGDITVADSNVHAGAKYMNQLMSKYFPDANFSEGNRPLFAFASYNCGPGNVAKARRAAEKQGLDPDKWFNNVEIVIAKQTGTKTTTYVRNIYKYYVAYRLLLDAQAEAAKARQQVAPPKS